MFNIKIAWPIEFDVLGDFFYLRRHLLCVWCGMLWWVKKGSNCSRWFGLFVLFSCSNFGLWIIFVMLPEQMKPSTPTSTATKSISSSPSSKSSKSKKSSSSSSSSSGTSNQHSSTAVHTAAASATAQQQQSATNAQANSNNLSNSNDHASPSSSKSDKNKWVHPAMPENISFSESN